MSPPHPHTPGLLVLEDEDDSDICPVCDGECTCSTAQPILRNPSPPQQHAPLSMAELSKRYAASTSSASTPSSVPRKHPFSLPISPTLAAIHSTVTPPSPPPPPPAPKQSLKIKLTVPPGMLKKRPETPSYSGKKYETTSVVVADGYVAPSPYPTSPPASTSTSIPDLFPKRRGRPPKHVVAAREAAKAAAAAHSSRGYATKLPPALLKKKPPVPVKKKQPRRRIVESDLSSLSELDERYDSSPNEDVEDDAESVQFPTFVSASVLSSMEEDVDSSSLSSFDSDSELEKEEECFIRAEHDKARVKRELLGDDSGKRRENDWVIRPRKKSVAGSDAEMDVDTDGSDEDEDGEGAGADEDEEEEEEEETDGAAFGAVGLVSGWSDDEESSFDADLFFANLSGSSSSTSSSDEDNGMIEDDEDTQSEMSFSGVQDAPSLGVGGLSQNLFEITEAWDGQVVFTNGLSEGQGVFDMDYIQHPFNDSTASPNSDVDMSSLPVEEVEDEEGYEEDEDLGTMSSGDTTDEELVGEDSLPNERAMRLFSFPFSVSAINPLSTVSPAVSPAPTHRRPAPRPSDILSGRAFWDSDDERGEGVVFGRTPGLRMGVFVLGDGEREEGKKERQAVIDEGHRGCVVPSPHPRYVRRKERKSAVEHAFRKHLLSTPSTPLQALPATPHSTPLPTDDTASAPPTSTEEDQSIEIYDVLEAAYLDEDNDRQSSSSMSESDSRSKHLRHLDRWNSIPVGAFRQTREVGGSGDWREDYGAIMKASPLSAMLWNKNPNVGGARQKRPAISPVMLPVRDGDRTPTSSSSFQGKRNQQQQQQSNNNGNGSGHKKSRQELRRERKLKRKSYNPSTHHQPHHHHVHHHHPNSKSRSSSSMQRNFLSGVPPFNL